jgi:hypothetical protein
MDLKEKNLTIESKTGEKKILLILDIDLLSSHVLFFLRYYIHQPRINLLIFKFLRFRIVLIY